MTDFQHCSDLDGDRALGARWEREFCKLASRKGRLFTPHQIGRKDSACAHFWTGTWHHLTLPDVTIWSCPGEHHEIKHKAPTRSGCFGLEDYRIKALKWFSEQTKQPVYYTIHNHNGNRDDVSCRDEDWVSASTIKLWQAINNRVAYSLWFDSYVGGQRKTVRGWFWPTGLWIPLLELWRR